MHVGDAAGEHGDNKEQHGDAPPDERTAAADEHDDGIDSRGRDGDDQPRRNDGEDEGEARCQHQGRDSQRNEGAGTLLRSARCRREVVAVAIGDRYDGHAVDDGRQSEGANGQPAWSQKVEVRIVGPQGIDLVAAITRCSTPKTTPPSRPLGSHRRNTT